MGFMLVFMQMTPTPGRIISQASEITDVAWDSINGLVTSAIERMPYILAGLLVLAIFYGAARLSKGLFWLATRRTKFDQRLRILFSRLIAIFLTILGIFTALSIIIPSFSFGNIIAGFGLTSVVIGFATKDIINNLLSGVMILWHKPFGIGDYLFIGNHQGKVEYIGVRATSLRKDDGEIILIPNGEMYSGAMTIRGAGALRRMNLKFSIGYDANVTKAKDLAKKALDSLDFIVEEPPSKVLVTDLTSEGVNITLNFWINTDKIRPRDAFDTAAVEVMHSLNAEKIAIFPPESLIVQRVGDISGDGAEASSARSTA
jgi:small conductance mechanosensitive channel